LQIFGPRGVLLSDLRYSNWQPIADVPLRPNGPTQFPRTVQIDRPHDDYKLDIQITKVVLNSELEAARFQLARPAGAELVRVTADAGPAGNSRGSNP